jgi:hypothetical protein
MKILVDEMPEDCTYCPFIRWRGRDTECGLIGVGLFVDRGYEYSYDSSADLCYEPRHYDCPLSEIGQYKSDEVKQLRERISVLETRSMQRATSRYSVEPAAKWPPHIKNKRDG